MIIIIIIMIIARIVVILSPILLLFSFQNHVNQSINQSINNNIKWVLYNNIHVNNIHGLPRMHDILHFSFFTPLLLFLIFPPHPHPCLLRDWSTPPQALSPFPIS